MAGTYTPKANHAAVFENEDKREEWSSDFKGDITVCCPRCGQESGAFVDILKKLSKTGKDYLALKLKFKERQA